MLSATILVLVSSQEVVLKKILTFNFYLGKKYFMNMKFCMRLKG